MSLDRAARRLVFWQVMLGIFAFCLIEPNPGLLLVAGSLAALSRYTSDGPRGWALPRMGINLGAIGALLLLAGELSARPERVVEAMGHFLMWLQVLILFGRRTDREHAQLMALSALQMTGASVLPRGGQALFAVLLAGYAAVTLAALFAHHLKSVRDRARAAQAALAPRGVAERAGLAVANETVLPRRIWLWAGCVAVVCGAAGAATFVAAPRGVKGRMAHALSHYTPLSARTSVGFSEAVSLDGSMLEQGSGRVALLLEAEAEPPRPADAWLLRAAVFDRYDPTSRGWRRLDRLTGLEFGARADRGRALAILDDDASMIEARLALRSHPPPSLPTLTWNRGQTAVASVDAGRLPVRLSTQAGLLSAAARVGGDIQYTLVRPRERVVALAEPEPAPAVRANAAGRGSPVASLHWPVETERCAALAASILAGAGVDWPPAESASVEDDTAAAGRRAAEVERAALALSNWLETRCDYALENPSSRGQDPVIEFLFEARRGHCELFASAMTALCRSVGIPARVATGYRASEFNTVGGYFTVRERHAHAWAEVDLGRGHGWLAIDPTPAGTVEQAHLAAAPWWSALQQAYEHLELKWVRDVIGFDAEARAGLLSRATAVVGRDGPLGLAVSAAWRGLGRGGRPAWFEVLAMGFLLFASAAAVLILTLLGLARRKKLSRLRVLELPRGERRRLARDLSFYLRMSDMLDRHGYARPAWQSPRDFADAVVSANPGDLEPIASLTDAFYRVRFGGARATAEDRRDRRRELRALESALLGAERRVGRLAAGLRSETAA
ncbi:MAG: transglutaminase domain-containing protein [Planctomycetota bacterium]